MTLPFRRRHHDDDASHDRARALISAELEGSLEPAEGAWLADHLTGCPECTADAEAYAADRALLRALRDDPPAPPRDLWARTSAAIERESLRGRSGQPAAARLGTLVPARQRLPLGLLSGALVVLVVVAVASVQTGAPVLPNATAGASLTAVGPTPASPTQIAIQDADNVAWIERNPDGTYALVTAPVNEACPTGDAACAPLAAGSPTPIELGSTPQSVVLSPNSNQVAVVGSSGSAAGAVVIVSVPTPQPSGGSSSPASSASASSQAPTRAPTVAPATPTPAGPSLTPSAAPSSIQPSVQPVAGGHAIITGVQVIGDTAYSASGNWLAFSARPLDSDAGPFLYVWHVGDDQATQLTFAGTETYFAGWFGDEIVASEVQRVEVDSATAAPTYVGVPQSFLLDPATGARQRFRADSAWLPSIDQGGRFVTYWSGTLVPVFASASAPAGPSATPASSDGSSTALGSAPPNPAPGGSQEPQVIIGWQLGQGRLVLDGWSDALAAPSPAGTGAASPASPAVSDSSSAPTSATPATGGQTGSAGGSPAAGPTATPEPFADGPAGTTIDLGAGSISSFDARFDPDGTRLAIWVSDGTDLTVGRLWLVLLDPTAGSIQTDAQPLPAPGVAALHGFSLESGRLGWVTPPGQNGEPSSVHVLAWNGEDFGQVQTVPGGSPQIVR